MAIIHRQFWDSLTQSEHTHLVDDKTFVVTGSVGGAAIICEISLDDLKGLMKRVQDLEERLAEIYLLDKAGDTKDV